MLGLRNREIRKQLGKWKINKKPNHVKNYLKIKKKLLSVPALNKFETTIHVFNINIINQQISYYNNTRNKFMNDSFYQVLPEQVKNKNYKLKKKLQRILQN